MIEVAFSSSFRRSLRRALKANLARRQRFEKALSVFIMDPFADVLRTHKLSGPLKGRWSFSVEHDLRVVFRFIEPDRAIFEEIGSHDEVYS